MKQKISIIAIAIMLVLVGCNSSTYMYDEWKSYVVGNKKGNLKIRVKLISKYLHILLKLQMNVKIL